MKNKIILILAIFVLSISFYSLYLFNQKEKYKKESTRLGQTLEAEMTPKEDFVFRDTINASKVKNLQLTNDELRKLRKEDAKTIKDLKLRIKDVQTIATIKPEIQIKEKLVFKDSCFSYNDGWNKASFCLNTDSFKLDVRDSIDIIITNIPKKFLWFKFGSKGYETILIPYNPKSKISYSKVIQLKK